MYECAVLDADGYCNASYSSCCSELGVSNINMLTCGDTNRPANKQDLGIGESPPQIHKQFTGRSICVPFHRSHSCVFFTLLKALIQALGPRKAAGAGAAYWM